MTTGRINQVAIHDATNASHLMHSFLSLDELYLSRQSSRFSSCNFIPSLPLGRLPPVDVTNQDIDTLVFLLRSKFSSTQTTPGLTPLT